MTGKWLYIIIHFGRGRPIDNYRRWEYVVQNNVRLPDEYDQIWNDLEPLWGLDPIDLRQIQAEIEAKKDTFTLGKTDFGTLSVVNSSLSDDRRKKFLSAADGIMDILKDVEHLIPEFRAVFSPHDNPNRLSDYDIKSITLEAAAARTCKLISYDLLYRINWDF